MRSAEKTNAIVLKVVDFSETSCVVTLFTREFGKLSALAKGARRPKSSFEAALDVLSICRVVFLRKSGDSLHLLTEAQLERRFRAAAFSLSRLYAAYYVAELLSRLTEDLDVHPRLFDFAEDTLRRLDPGGDARSVHSGDTGEVMASYLEVQLILLQFQMGILSLLGHFPLMDRCCECAVGVDSGRISFGLNDGGLLCEKCRRSKRHLVSLSGEANLLLREQANLGYARDRAARSEELRGKNAGGLAQLPLGEVRGLLDQYLAHLLGQLPRMVSYCRERQFASAAYPGAS